MIDNTNIIQCITLQNFISLFPQLFLNRREIPELIVLFCCFLFTYIWDKSYYMRLKKILLCAGLMLLASFGAMAQRVSNITLDTSYHSSQLSLFIKNKADTNGRNIIGAYGGGLNDRLPTYRQMLTAIARAAISGTANYASKFNLAGNNVINSRIFDDGNHFGVNSVKWLDNNIYTDVSVNNSNVFRSHGFDNTDAIVTAYDSLLRAVVSIHNNGRQNLYNYDGGGSVYVLYNLDAPFNGMDAGHYAWGAVNSGGQRNTTGTMHNIITDIDQTHTNSKFVWQFMADENTTGYYHQPNTQMTLDKNGLDLGALPLIIAKDGSNGYSPSFYLTNGARNISANIQLDSLNSMSFWNYKPGIGNLNAMQITTNGDVNYTYKLKTPNATVESINPQFIINNLSGTTPFGIVLQQGGGETGSIKYNPATGEFAIGGTQSYSFPTFLAGNVNALTFNPSNQVATFAATINGSINGNSGTVTNGVYTTASYSNPSWLTSFDYSKLTGTVPIWNQNTTGSALLWNTYNFDVTSTYNTGFDYVLARKTASTEVRQIGVLGLQTFLGLGSNAYTSGGFVQLAGSNTVSANNSFTGTNSFIPIIAAGTYGTAVAGASGAARDIFTAFQTSGSVGLTVQWNGTKMIYGMADGDLTVGGNITASSGIITAPAIKLTTGATNGYIATSDASGNLSWQAPTGGVPSGSDGQIVSYYDGGVPLAIGRMSVQNANVVFIPTTGGTTTLFNNEWNVIAPSGALAALTIAMPSSPADGDVVHITITQAITSLSFSGGTVVSSPTTISGRTELNFVYNNGASTWY